MKRYSREGFTFLLGSTLLIFKGIVFRSGGDLYKSKYKHPANFLFLFLFGVVCTSYLVAEKISRVGGTGRPRKSKIFKIISPQVFLGTIVAMFCRYVIPKRYNDENSEIYKAIIAMIVFMVILILIVVCENLALQSSTFVDPGRSFVLVYLLDGVSKMIYRIMQGS